MASHVAYCGIDVGLKIHTVCLLGKNQEIIRKYSIPNNIKGFRTLEADIDKNTLICLEPTGVYSVNLFLYFKRNGYNIKFCGTHSSFYFRQSRFNKKKHDKLDSVALAKYRIVNEDLTFEGSKLIEKLAQNNYVCDPDYIALSDLVDRYMKKSKRMSILKNKIKNIIDLRFPEAIQIFSSDRGCKAILKALQHSKEDILNGKVKLDRLNEIQEKLKNSIGQYDFKVFDFKNYVEELRILEYEVENLKQAVKERLSVKGYSSLFNYWGLDTISIAILVTEIRNIKRFYKFNQNGCFNKKRSLKAFKKFLGIAVTSNQSGKHEGAHKLTKSGNMKLRSVVFMMAMRYISLKPKGKSTSSENNNLDPCKFRTMYEQLVEKGYKKLIAITKVMNKIATDLFFVFKNIAETQNQKTA